MYLLDANVFINAYRDYYSFDIVPDFWNRLVSLAGNSQICSIDKIRDELCTNIENPDELHIWSASQFEAYFKETDATDVIEAYSRIQQWAFGNPQFTEAAKVNLHLMPMLG